MRSRHSRTGALVDGAAAASKTVLRCAIYTRVSSDSGLEQDFNSLDAQREAAEAYVKSQSQEGWKLVREAFDDGGFSGGSTNRPALQKLLERIRERRIDVVVVYKVDRLTRSLADFAKLVELFDAHKVSFVSVTQAFNTTNSMGRLTLNVLLSFAQFEREVTGERIRDKIAASKKKGLWMGGRVPFGYRVEDRKLLIVEEEAAIVRLIFDLYLQHQSIPAVQADLRSRGIRTRVRRLASGEESGGGDFTNGPISHILTNRHYLGEINHKGRSWPGEHEPLIDPALFDRVQDELASRRQRRSTHVLSSGALLMSRIFNDSGEGLSPTYSCKKGVRYRYYTARSRVQGQRGEAGTSIQRLPAGPIEALVLEQLKTLAGPSFEATDRDLVAAMLEKIVVHRDAVILIIRDPDDTTSPAQAIRVPWHKPDSHRRHDIIMPAEAAEDPTRLRVEDRDRLLRSIATARRWIQELIEGAVVDLPELARREGRSERSVRMTLSLAFLDPAIVAAICDRRLPRGYGLTKLADLPPSFGDQWRALGLSRPA